ncbi:hypothetical protein M426DRAFT_9757 [Hypoxylon sp. CI-4A]|nr:hypothetical protein M426DRAFT_9757 [Hypoxylon sp. CI-4A]
MATVPANREVIKIDDSSDGSDAESPYSGPNVPNYSKLDHWGVDAGIYLELYKWPSKDKILSLFPGIQFSHLYKVAKEHGHDFDITVADLLDRQEKGEQYPIDNPLKRKRADDEDEEGSVDESEKIAKELRKEIANPDHANKYALKAYEDMATNLIAMEFPVGSFKSYPSDG